jgi:hypothetical protein
MKKFFGDSCLPQCGDGEKGFNMVVASDADCPADIYFEYSHHVLPEVAVRRKEYCEPEVRHNELKSFLWIYLI